MKRYKVEFKLDVPDTMTDKEVEDFVRFELHDNGQLSGDNPLVDECIQPVRWSVEVEEAL